MEEKKPLESHSLTHTSKELEGQVWAQIGTSSYDPSKKQASTAPPVDTTVEMRPPSAEKAFIEKTKQIDAENGDCSTPEATSGAVVANEQTNSQPEVEKEKKEDEEPKSDSAEVATTAGEERRSRNMVGDGFDTNSKEDRSRSRSRSRDRKQQRRAGSRGSHSPPASTSSSGSTRKKRQPYADYGTNSRNPNDIRSRVFIGHLNTDSCTRDELEELFKPYGKIAGVNLQSGYGFVQFEEEDSVRMAIKQVHGTSFKGSNLGMSLILSLNFPWLKPYSGPSPILALALSLAPSPSPAQHLASAELSMAQLVSMAPIILRPLHITLRSSF